MAVNTQGLSLTQRLESLKQSIERGKTEKARAEATLESLQRQEAEIHAELAELGVLPENLEAEIKRVRETVEQGLQEAERLLQG